jgi:hypothetical protein
MTIPKGNGIMVLDKIDDMNALKKKIQAKLTEKKSAREQTTFAKPPRYDDIFFEGIKWLDSLAGEPVQE